MRKLSYFIPLLSLLAGGVGFYLRRVELDTAFEPVTGLAIRGDTSTTVLVIATMLFFILATAFSVFISQKFISPNNFSNTFSSYLVNYPLTVIPVCILWVGGSIVHLINLRLADLLQSYDVYFIVLSLLAAISIILFTIEMFQNLKRKAAYALSLMPIVFLCFWLIMLYRQNAANPVLQSYVYQCLAIVASILTFYYTAGFLYGKPSSSKAVAVYCVTIFLCVVAIADDIGLGMMLIFVAISAFATVHLYLLLHNLLPKSTKTEYPEVSEDSAVELIIDIIDRNES